MQDDGGRQRGGRTTQRGFGTLPVKERAGGASDRAAGPAEAPGEAHLPSRVEEPPIEVERVEEHGPPALLDGQWRAYEVWTAQHIYVLSDDLCCLEVIDRAAGRAETGNEIVGARLVGGELRDGKGMIRQVFHPLPQRGSRAVFTRAVGERQRMSETSPVTRVVLRQRVVSLTGAAEGARVRWKEITGRHELP